MWYINENSVFMIDDENDDIKKLELEDLIPKELVDFLSNKIKTVITNDVNNWNVGKALIYILGNGSVTRNFIQDEDEVDDYDIVSLEINEVTQDLTDNEWILA